MTHLENMYAHVSIAHVCKYDNWFSFSLFSCFSSLCLTKTLLSWTEFQVSPNGKQALRVCVFLLFAESSSFWLTLPRLDGHQEAEPGFNGL